MKTQKIRCYADVADELEKIALQNGLKTMADTIAFVVKEFDNVRSTQTNSSNYTNKFTKVKERVLDFVKELNHLR